MGPGAAVAGTLTLQLEAVDINTEAPGERRVGKLEFLAGFRLTSSVRSFGGISGLVLDEDGRGFTAITDQGRWLTGKLLLAPDGRLRGIADANILPMRMPDGSLVRATAGMRDAEAVERLADGSLIVGFEQRHRVWRYSATTSPAETYVGGSELAAQPDNGGIEAMAPLADGTLLLLSEEGRDAKGDHRGWLRRSGKLLPLSYVAKKGFAPTDIARLGDGDLLVLERRFNPLTGFGARIVRLAGSAVVPGARLEGEEIARFEWPYLVENYEALAAVPAADSGSYVYLASDDNFNVFQSTLLLQFRLAP